MATKLTLSVDPQIVKDIKRYARQEGTSVSAVFERFARSVTRGGRPARKMGPLTRRAAGMLKVPASKTDRQLLEEALLERYRLP